MFAPVRGRGLKSVSPEGSGAGGLVLLSVGVVRVHRLRIAGGHARWDRKQGDRTAGITQHQHASARRLDEGKRGSDWLCANKQDCMDVAAITMTYSRVPGSREKS